MAFSIYLVMKLKNKTYSAKEDFYIKVKGYGDVPKELELLLYYLIYLPDQISYSESTKEIDIWKLVLKSAS